MGMSIEKLERLFARLMNDDSWEADEDLRHKVAADYRDKIYSLVGVVPQNVMTENQDFKK